MMNLFDVILQKIQFWIRSKPLLYRFTLGTRILLAIGFIPTGMVKLLGYRFTTLSTQTEVGAFFEVLYQSGLYWQFLGFIQILAGLLVLIPAASALGALLFLGIMMNIFMITLSYDFAFTPIITSQMLLASVWLIMWDYDRFRSLLFNHDSIKEKSQSFRNLPKLSLSNNYERLIYVMGTISGLLFFSILRGLALPTELSYALLFVCFICFITAIVFGLRNTRI